MDATLWSWELPLVIDPTERDAWFRHMIATLNFVVAERERAPDAEQRMREDYSMSVEAMRNV